MNLSSRVNGADPEAVKTTGAVGHRHTGSLGQRGLDDHTVGGPGTRDRTVPSSRANFNSTESPGR